MATPKFGPCAPLFAVCLAIGFSGSGACLDDGPPIGSSASANGTANDTSDSNASDPSGAEGNEGATNSGDTNSSDSNSNGSDPSDSDDASSTGNDSNGTSGGGCNGECGTPGCGECPPSNPMPVPGQDFSIGNTEISNGAYLAFLDTNPSLSLQSDVCGWNETFEPVSQWPPDDSEYDYPVVYVNWCQAEAYCKWSGGRLCARIGGGVLPTNQHSHPDKSEWMNACSANGTQEYPYGPEYEPLACNGEDFQEAGPLVVTQPTTCQGSLPGLHNMSGNVYEWVNECDLGQDENDLCRRRGGSYWSEPNLMRCAMGSSRPRDHVDDYTGIRCCYD